MKLVRLGRKSCYLCVETVIFPHEKRVYCRKGAVFCLFICIFSPLVKIRCIPLKNFNEQWKFLFAKTPAVENPLTPNDMMLKPL